MFNQNRGFTLIELMLALAISVILTCAAYPTYISYEVDAQRDRAEIALLQFNSRLEAYFEDHNTYRSATLSALHTKDLGKGLQYRLSILKKSKNHFEIQAIPIGAQALRDKTCGTLTLTDNNKRDINGAGDASDCWR